MEEMKELFKALGYVGGEVHEVTKDGFGVEDLQSLKEMYDNREMLAKGFDVPGDFKDHLKNIGIDGLMEIIMAAKEGFEQGKK
jgi:hypothetical protein